jgi:NCAIR mutase (PurE)-related protein
MRETLDALAAGEITPGEAETRLRGYSTITDGDTDARFDAARETRRGIPEGILADDKTAAEVVAVAERAVETSGRAVVTRVEDDLAETVLEALGDSHPDATVERDERAQTVVAHAPDFEPPSVNADVAVVSAGLADAQAAGEAAVIATEAGPRVERFDDVGVANLDRILDVVPTLREFDVVVVAAGREGALPTVVAGRLDAPVIALPVSAGYGAGRDGIAALLGMLQSCTALSTVNVDAGFVAGTQAALIARRVAAARSGKN